MFFLKDQSCFIHLKTDQPCSILMRLSLLFNFFKPFFQCFAVLEQQMGQHCLGWRGHKTPKRCEHHQRHPGWASQNSLHPLDGGTWILQSYQLDWVHVQCSKFPHIQQHNTAQVGCLLVGLGHSSFLWCNSNSMSFLKSEMLASLIISP